MVYTIIRKRHVFHALANLPSDLHGISKCLNTRKGVRTASRIVPAPRPASPRVEVVPKADEATSTGQLVSVNASPILELEGNGGAGGESSDCDTKSDIGESSMEGSKPALPAEPGTLKVSLLDTPGKS